MSKGQKTGLSGRGHRLSVSPCDGFYVLYAKQIRPKAGAVAGWLDAFVDDDVLPLSHRDQIKILQDWVLGLLKTASSSPACLVSCEGLAGRRAEVGFLSYLLLFYLLKVCFSLIYQYFNQKKVMKFHNFCYVFS
ncbi:TPA: hypothetical protein ACJWJD_004536 [Salmonella enterica subsp. enterica serovar Braenderup]